VHRLTEALRQALTCLDPGSRDSPRKVMVSISDLRTVLVYAETHLDSRVGQQSQDYEAVVRLLGDVLRHSRP